MRILNKAIEKLDEIGIFKRKVENPTGQISYQPYIPSTTDVAQLLVNLQDLLGIELSKLQKMWSEYEIFSKQKNYAEVLGERKTLSTEEAFIIYTLASHFRPQNFIEIGTQHGRSTRRIIDLSKKLGLNASVNCFDIVNLARYFSSDEANLILKDITKTVEQDIFERYESGIIYLDAHPYFLLKNVMQAVLNHPSWILVIHDCSRGLCNPNMQIAKEDYLSITSLTGHWERHVLAEVFGVADVMSDELNRGESEHHVRMILDTPHGLGVILPKQLTAYQTAN